MPIGDKMTPGTPAGGGDGEPSVMWSNNVPLPAPGRLALIILSRVGCRQYEHVAREGDTTIPPSSVRLQRHTTLHIITLDLIPSYLHLSASRAHSSEYFSFAWSSFIWFERLRLSLKIICM